MDCLFCSIVAGDIPASKLYEDDEMIAFYDIEPQAPLHFLVIPKKHISSAAEITNDESELIGRIYTVISKICREQNAVNGYRVVTNIGEDGGQTVKHLHFHVLAKRSLSWPPG